MAALGFSLNTLTLFGMVLAIGIVVDDAIVVVENVERNIALGMTPRDAAHGTMDEVGTAPSSPSRSCSARCSSRRPSFPASPASSTRQFALTIAVSTLISAFISLTLSPALAALLLRPHDARAARASGLAGLGHRAASALQPGLRPDRGRLRRTPSAARAAQAHRAAGLCGAARGDGVDRQRRAARLHPAARPGLRHRRRAAARRRLAVAHRRVVQRASEIARETPGVEHAVAFAGFSGATFTNASNAGGDLRAASSPSRSASRQGRQRRRHHRRALRPPAGDRGSLHHRHSAAAGARHRQFRRLQAAGAGAASAPRSSACSRRPTS